ncbi:bifunctional diaminohydroxyphosphoribosylaminopyrimidine deaminase/5-amino-6-(5-phosphoribosylamino)uracil reductase RibD [Burkholderia thailandensis]|uniref:bifunctional diaminohydroxyphosphoribosylaminopyrimidine deaminase/5-amino-6-(5-phosphoribosylamino)uracil reductase RibD n=1 Tax=Burkholderia thailandensis TaxID=57975 RepID=UPI0022AC030B|nr:bifunctional diaminohydroxyphosphoribosylaminopyrimidine deaminase/5-amino-6-(5-phosphoribosylamino)uracil reductase RibD [Burkholderia thailandensis]MCZ2900936.1 bifunctional diaminohydroxyphosphoribosylaminopyrimidine deaminase/5-amino-6-(5-phosphoribosylamino)uracil reductase RibD [Burkholderia thailandensis]MDD1480790.1 bifunctional diaminohydroxyphosphoribosylaminopyrimidine deaminase/5-amino-6-(5-phosphoribosylamino)uracil reductase RibD [Burkholderia thailandensis]MDD1487663.1 bifuncti
MSTFSDIDRMHMAHALRLAEQGLYTTHPNPRVGCVIARGAQALGAGWHRRAGEPHAEVHALREAGERARGATAYVTLEPCAHFGRTPPCANALVAAGVARVVIAARDPFEQVAGRGAARLADAGIVVEQGLLEAQARELNIGFFSRIERGRPWTRATLSLPIGGPPAPDSADLAALDAAPSEARDDLRHWRARSSVVLERAPDAGRAVGRDGAAPRYVVSARDCAALGAASVACARAGGVPTLALHRDDKGGRACEDARGSGHRALRVDRVDARPAGAPSAPVADTDACLPLPDAFARLAKQGVNELFVEADLALCDALFGADLADELLLYAHPASRDAPVSASRLAAAIDDVARRWGLRPRERLAIGRGERIVLRRARGPEPGQGASGVTP